MPETKKGAIGIVDPINSECVSGIADYFGLLETVKRMENTDISVYGILNQNHKSLLDYYLDKFDIDTSDGLWRLSMSRQSRFTRLATTSRAIMYGSFATAIC